VVTPVGTSAPVAPVSNSGGSLNADGSPGNLADQADSAGNAQPATPAAPTQHPAPPTGDGALETGVEDTVPLFLPAVDAVFSEAESLTAAGLQPGELLTPAGLPAEATPQQPAMALGLVAALALGCNGGVRQDGERRRLRP